MKEALTHDKQTPNMHCRYYSKHALIYFTNMMMTCQRAWYVAIRHLYVFYLY